MKPKILVIGGTGFIGQNLIFYQKENLTLLVYQEISQKKNLK